MKVEYNVVVIVQKRIFPSIYNQILICQITLFINLKAMSEFPEFVALNMIDNEIISIARPTTLRADRARWLGARGKTKTKNGSILKSSR